MCEWRCNVFVKDIKSYQPDTIDLNKDAEAASYWFPCMHEAAEKYALQAAKSQRDGDDTAEDRAKEFKQSYQSKLEEYRNAVKENSANDKVLGLRELLELNGKELRLHGFEDAWIAQKISENELALSIFPTRLEELDNIVDYREKWIELVSGVLAGNMFDWGAQAVTNIMENDKSFGLHAALGRIQQRPWLIDDLEHWLVRLQGSKHKCAAIFVDNSGIDIVLGVLPFARELLKRGTKVILCANRAPSLNDVTSYELRILIDRTSRECPILYEGCTSGNLMVFENGQSGPCLDMRTLPQNLCEALETNETDLLVIEGMGRAVHTNLNANFNCETLKLAVVKNKWLAQRLGGDIFSVICKFEQIS